MVCITNLYSSVLQDKLSKAVVDVQRLCQKNLLLLKYLRVSHLHLMHLWSVFCGSILGMLDATLGPSFIHATSNLASEITISFFCLGFRTL